MAEVVRRPSSQADGGSGSRSYSQSPQKKRLASIRFLLQSQQEVLLFKWASQQVSFVQLSSFVPIESGEEEAGQGDPRLGR